MDPATLAILTGSGGRLIEQFTGLAAVVGPFVLVAWFLKLRHDRNVRALSAQDMGAEERRALAEMNEVARRMEQRVENLERILDNELSGWRSRMLR